MEEIGREVNKPVRRGIRADRNDLQRLMCRIQNEERKVEKKGCNFSPKGFSVKEVSIFSNTER